MIRQLDRLFLQQKWELLRFAVIITVIFICITSIVEASRFLWVWASVQNAADVGARYASTGQYETSCAVAHIPKFVRLCDERNDLRMASIIAHTRDALLSLPLNETSNTFTDDSYYNIEVWGLNDKNELQYDFGGLPRGVVVVRVTYRVPLISGAPRIIVSSIPVFGQSTLANEPFNPLIGVPNASTVPKPVQEDR